MEQALATHKEWEEEKFSHNGTAHIEMRDDTSELEKQIEKARPAIEWVMGIRRAWGRILIALIITGLITVGSALLKVYALWKSLPPIGGGP